jgi:6,7-dimethyl-8-ribityllumazine synthase
VGAGRAARAATASRISKDNACGLCSAGIGAVARRHDLPIAFGVLTTDTMAQALARAGGEAGNKGYDAALTALEMVQVFRALQKF